MLKILFIEDDPSLIDKITFVLESLSNVQISVVKNFKEAEQALLKHKDFNLIVADYRCGNTKEVLRFQSLASEVNCIISLDDLNDTKTINGWKIIDKIERINLAAGLKNSLELHYPSETSDKLKFCRIKTSILLETSPLNADIYAKLSDVKFIKIFLAGDVFDASDFQKYTERKKIEYMYLREDSCGIFINKYIDQIDDFIKKNYSPPPPYDQLAKMNMVAYESIQELTSTIGFTKEVQELTKAHVDMTVKFMDKKPNLQKMLDKMKEGGGKYTTDHSYMISYIACAIATNLEWASESTFFKLSLASFLHDFSIVDERFITCSTMAEANLISSHEKELVTFKNHPIVAADLVKKMSEIPPDVDVIIAQHHEQPDGKGFPKGISAAQIAPLSAVFIFAQEMVKNIFTPPEGGFILADFLNETQSRYQHSSFKKVFNAAKKLDT